VTDSGNIFQYLGTSIDSALNSFITTTSTRLCGLLIPVISTALTLWVLCFGWSVIRGEAREPIQSFVYRAMKLSLTLSFALGAGLYQGEVVSAANGLSETLAAAGSDSSTTNIYQAMDRLNDEGGHMAANVVSRGEELLPISGYTDILTGILMILVIAIVLLVAVSYVLLAKVGLALVLGFGPIFIACMAFSQTRRFFDAWLSKLMNYTFLMALMAAMTALILRVYGHYIEAFLSQDISRMNAVQQLAELVLISGAITVITLQVPKISAGLTGGAAVTGMGGAALGVASRLAASIENALPDARSVSSGLRNVGAVFGSSNRIPSPSTNRYHEAVLEWLHERPMPRGDVK